jgi:hypothetical protein
MVGIGLTELLILMVLAGVLLSAVGAVVFVVFTAKKK